MVRCPIGSAGGAEKCAWVRELGADAAIDYKAQPVVKGLDRACSVVSDHAVASSLLASSSVVSIPITICDTGLGLDPWFSFVTRDVGPQRVLRRGGEAVVVVPAEDFDRMTEREKQPASLAEFFRAAPTRGKLLDLTRKRDTTRTVKW